MTVRLNARLAQIASYIRQGESVCDVGTDHGYIPIYLAENDIADKIIMSDVSKGSIAKAIKDARDELEDPSVIDARFGDGFDVLEPGEVDDIIIAGMGGIQILDILSWDMSKTLTYKKFIFQPRRDAATLRKWLEVNRFTITDDVIVPENGRFSEIICCTSEGASNVNIYFYEHMTLLGIFDNDPAKLAAYEYPADLRDPSGKDVDKAYFSSELEKIKGIMGNIRTNSSSGGGILELFEKRVERLKSLCRKNN